MMNEQKLQGVMCKVTNCQYHSKDNRCTASQIEVGNCDNCGCAINKEDASFCSTYKKA